METNNVHPIFKGLLKSVEPKQAESSKQTEQIVRYRGYDIYRNYYADYGSLNQSKTVRFLFNNIDGEESVGSGESLEYCKEQIDKFLDE